MSSLGAASPNYVSSLWTYSNRGPPRTQTSSGRAAGRHMSAAQWMCGMLRPIHWWRRNPSRSHGHLLLESSTSPHALDNYGGSSLRAPTDHVRPLRWVGHTYIGPRRQDQTVSPGHVRQWALSLYVVYSDCVFREYTYSRGVLHLPHTLFLAYWTMTTKTGLRPTSASPSPSPASPSTCFEHQNQCCIITHGPYSLINRINYWLIKLRYIKLNI